MVIYTVTSRGLCCTDALSILHFAKLSDTSVDKISHLYQRLSPPAHGFSAQSCNKTKQPATWRQGAAPKQLMPNRKNIMGCFTMEYGSDKAPGAAVAIMTVFCWGAKEEVRQVVKKWQSPRRDFVRVDGWLAEMLVPGRPWFISRFSF